MAGNFFALAALRMLN